MAFATFEAKFTVFKRTSLADIFRGRPLFLMRTNGIKIRITKARKIENTKKADRCILNQRRPGFEFDYLLHFDISHFRVFVIGIL